MLGGGYGGGKQKNPFGPAVHRCFRPAESTHTARPNGGCPHPRRSEPSTAAPPRGVARLLFEPEARFISARRVRRALGGARSAGDRALCARRSDRACFLSVPFFVLHRMCECRGRRDAQERPRAKKSYLPWVSHPQVAVQSSPEAIRPRPDKQPQPLTCARLTSKSPPRLRDTPNTIIAT